MLRAHRVAFIAIAGIVAMFASGTGGAGASERFGTPVITAPDGTGTACTNAEPCGLVEAMDVAEDGSTIYMPAGATYDVGSTTLNVPDGTLLGSLAFGSPNAPKATIVSSAPTAVRLGQGTAMWDAAIAQTGGATALDLVGPSAQAQRVNIVTSGQLACRLGDGSSVDDSFCIDNSTAAGGAAIAMSLGHGTAALRGVTAVATGPASSGADAAALDPGGSVSIDAQNSILSGTGTDVRARATSGASATVTLDHSNFATTDPGSTGTTSITSSAPPNQSAEPSFADPAADDYHEDPQSPTVDAGYPGEQTGSIDFDGELRWTGYPIDIGADEIVDRRNPNTRMTDHPKRKTYSRNATFRFVSDDPDAWFHCDLDRHSGSGRTCTSPHIVRHLNPGWHTMSIEANDDHGNGDPSPAIFRWKVKRKEGVRYRPRLTNCGRVRDPYQEHKPLILAHKVGCKVARKVARYWFGTGPRPAGWGCWSSYGRCYKGEPGSSQWITTKDNRRRRPAEPEAEMRAAVGSTASG